MATALLYKKIAELKKESISGLEKKLKLSNGAIKAAIGRNSIVKQDTIDKMSKLYPDIDFKQLEIDMLNEQLNTRYANGAGAKKIEEGTEDTVKEPASRNNYEDGETVATLARANETQARANERQAIANEETARALNRILDRMPEPSIGRGDQEIPVGDAANPDKLREQLTLVFAQLKKTTYEEAEAKLHIIWNEWKKSNKTGTRVGRGIEGISS